MAAKGGTKKAAKASGRGGKARSEAHADAPDTVVCQDVRREYKLGEEVVRALRGVSLTIRRGEYISIMGPSGSGKSTLFNMIGGLDKPTAGKVMIDGVDIADLNPDELAWMRCRKIGYIFQTFNLIPVMTALDNVTLPMIFAGLEPDEYLPKGKRLLELVGLGERLNHKPFELSGGQQQRVAIARSLANDPAIILADEPTGNLDLKTGQEIIQLCRRLNREQGVTIISATHDLKMIDVSDRVFWIRDGAISKIEKRSEIKIKVGEIHG